MANKVVTLTAQEDEALQRWLYDQLSQPDARASIDEYNLLQAILAKLREP